MPKFTTPEIIERRNKVQALLSEGNTLEEISNELQVSYETIKNDKKYLKKDAFRILNNSGADEMAYQYCTMMQNILNCNKKCWEIFHAKDSSSKIKLQALKISIECNRELNQLVKDSTSVITLENLKKKVEELTASQDNTAVRSYMTVPLPSFVESDNVDYR
jgi:DNA-binding CsgD family transcriptional regulator